LWHSPQAVTSISTAQETLLRQTIAVRCPRFHRRASRCAKTKNAQAEQPKDSAELGIRSLLSTWTESFKEKDLARQVDCYAPVMETYFLRHNVSRDFVKSDKSRTFSTIKEVCIFEISDIKIEFASSSNASVKFRKKWDTSLASGKRFSGEEIEQLQLANLDGGWKIVSEKEIQIVKVEGHSPP
jgi:hypothetical protein